MKQILQNLRSGQTELADVPCPAVPAGHLLIRTTRSLISAGTERMLVDFGKAGLIDKARQQPDKVRMVIDKARTDGVLPTLEAVRNKLDQPLALGYCNVGRVIEVGHGVAGFDVGDLVASNGKHAEFVAVPVNLCAKVPPGVSDDEAAFTVLAAIALQGIRLTSPQLGEGIAVMGVGLIGLAAVQLLRAHGCRVLAIDFDGERLALARSFGAETVDLSQGGDPLAAAAAFSRGQGIDAVLLTASTKSSEPVHQAAQMCRKRGRIVLVGVTGLELSRADFYDKELTFQVSCSYGPGRYDPSYEQKGLDYPIGFVRWTEQRNFEAVLDMMASGRIALSGLVSHRFPIADAVRAYDVIGGAERSLGVLLTYRDEPHSTPAEPRARTVSLPPAPAGGQAAAGTAPGLALIGSGNYATGVLIPAFKAAGARLRMVVSSGGVSSFHAGRKYGFETASTDVEAALADPGIAAVVVTTRHDTHAALVVRALAAGKHVFVEKPLALNAAHIDDIEAAHAAAIRAGRQPLLMVGFNRRFAPLVMRMKELLAARPGPKAMVMTVNAGAIPPDHWTQDPGIGGGRIVGEACHFIDLLRNLAGAPITGHHIQRMTSTTGDTATITLAFADGSTGCVLYFANGDKSFPKERLEVFAGGSILQLDNFHTLRAFGIKGLKKVSTWRQDKGQKACAAAFVNAVAASAPPPIPVDEIFEVSRVTAALSASQPAL